MKRLILVVIALIICSIYANAQYRSQEVGLQTDNDAYLAQGSDRYYTNGIFLFYRQALPFDIDGKLANKVLGFEAGQKMFNPQSGFIPQNGQFPPQTYIDRPFAAYLYLGTTYNLLFKSQSNLKLGAQIGIVGPKAYGRQAQEFIHKTFGFYPPQGWEYQIKNNAEINLSAEYNKMLFRNSVLDLDFSSYLNVGNGFTGAGFGPMFRLGRSNKLFNSISTQSTVMNRDGVKANDQEIFFYYKPLVNIIGYDATVQGKIGHKADLDSEEITLKPERLMISNQLGVAYNTGDRWTFNLSAIFHTKDVKTMVQAHQWGSLVVMYHFN